MAVVLARLLFVLSLSTLQEAWGYPSGEAAIDLVTQGGDSKNDLRYSEDVLRNMNKNVNPCDDFYQFACGNYVTRTTIPDDAESVGLFDTVKEKVQLDLRTIIEQPDEKRPFSLINDLYKACMDTKKIEEIGLSHVKDILQRLGGWPVLEGDQWDASKFTWKDTVYTLKDEGFDFNSLIDFVIEPDPKHSNKKVITLDQASLELDRESLVKGMEEELVQALYNYKLDISVMFGADQKRAPQELREALDFQIQLANISTPKEQRRDANRMYNPMTVTQLKEKYPSIPWVEYISALLPKTVEVQPDEIVIVKEPTYIEKLETLLSTTPKRTIANYMLWRAVASVVAQLTEKLRQRQLEFWKATTGVTRMKPRWDECVNKVHDSLTLAVGSKYVQSFFKEETKKAITEMVDKILNNLYKILKNEDWLDDKTRENALEKARAMKQYIGYPDELLDIQKLEEYYQKVEVTQGKYLESMLNIERCKVDFDLERFREPVNATQWMRHGDAPEVNAFYEEYDNSITMPAGILQGGFFTPGRPNYMNYGAIGSVIGHEITHGFDDECSQYDKNGNLVDWWTKETKEAYLKKATCIINQYGNYTHHQVGMKLNGVNTQGENIADNGGIKLAYRAYNNWVAEHGEEKRLPGLQDFSPRQMFWISAANLSCAKYRDNFLREMIRTDTHSPEEFRILGTFSNCLEFAKDFKCQAGSRMNPPNKCQIW